MHPSIQRVHAMAADLQLITMHITVLLPSTNSGSSQLPSKLLKRSMHSRYALQSSVITAYSSHAGCSIEFEIWRGRHSRGWYGPQEHESPQGQMASHIFGPWSSLLSIGWRLYGPNCGQAEANASCKHSCHTISPELITLILGP